MLWWGVHRVRGTSLAMVSPRACFGDSGGPLVVGREGSWELAGIVSGGGCWCTMAGPGGIGGEACATPGTIGLATEVQTWLTHAPTALHHTTQVAAASVLSFLTSTAVEGEYCPP